MNRRVVLKHEFVEYVPERLANDTLYVSMAYATAAHKCCCGCGSEVVTPLSPTDWQLAFDGETVSLYPSIGNWNFRCRSHYWIENSRIRWAPRWAVQEIATGRADDRLAKERHFNRAALPDAGRPTVAQADEQPRSLWSRIRRRLKR